MSRVDKLDVLRIAGFTLVLGFAVGIIYGRYSAVPECEAIAEMETMCWRMRCEDTGCENGTVMDERPALPGPPTLFAPNTPAHYGSLYLSHGGPVCFQQNNGEYLCGHYLYNSCRGWSEPAERLDGKPIEG